MKLTDQFDVCVASEAYEAGRRDDGHPYTAERFYVSLTAPDGTRYRHSTSWNGCRVERGEEGAPIFVNVSHEARLNAFQLGVRIQAAGCVDLAHWDEVDPAYASPAYINSGIEAERAYADRFDN